jgi:hypothetical protein
MLLAGDFERKPAAVERKEPVGQPPPSHCHGRSGHPPAPVSAGAHEIIDHKPEVVPSPDHGSGVGDPERSISVPLGGDQL